MTDHLTTAQRHFVMSHIRQLTINAENPCEGQKFVVVLQSFNVAPYSVGA